VFDVIFTGLVANVNNFHCGASHLRQDNGYFDLAVDLPVVWTKRIQNPGGGIKRKRNSTIEATGLLAIRISESGCTPCKLCDWSRFVPLANSLHITSWSQIQRASPWGSLGLKLVSIMLRCHSLYFIHCMGVYLTGDLLSGLVYM